MWVKSDVILAPLNSIYLAYPYNFRYKGITSYHLFFIVKRTPYIKQDRFGFSFSSEETRNDFVKYLSKNYPFAIDDEEKGLFKLYKKDYNEFEKRALMIIQNNKAQQGEL